MFCAAMHLLLDGMAGFGEASKDVAGASGPASRLDRRIAAGAVPLRLCGVQPLISVGRPARLR
jgi:hypothetical protein